MTRFAKRQDRYEICWSCRKYSSLPWNHQNSQSQWSRWQEYNCDCYVWLLFITSGVFLPTTDELCNLARGVDTRNVQLDPRTKTTIKGCSVLTSALLTLCLSPKCFSAASVVCPKSRFVPIHAHIWFPSESASQPVVIFCETNFIGSMWGGVGWLCSN